MPLIKPVLFSGRIALGKPYRLVHGYDIGHVFHVIDLRER